MMKTNFLFSSLSQFFKNFSNLIVLIFFAKLLTLNDFGIFSYALAIANIFIILFDYGYNYKLTKEMAQDTNNFDNLMQKAFKVKIILSILGLFCFFIIYASGVWSKEYYWTILLLIVSSVFSSFANDINTPFRVLNKFHIETIHYGIYSLALICLSVFSLLYYEDLFYLALAFLLARFLFFIVSYFNVVRLLNIKVFGNMFKKVNLFFELKEGLPYALQVGSSVFMVSIDTLILERYGTTEDIGLYQAGIKILIAATFFIAVIQNVLLPSFSNYIKNDKMKFINQHNRYTLFCVLLGLVIALGVFFLRNEIIYLLFGENFEKLSFYMVGFSGLIILRYFALTYGLVLTVSGNQNKRLYSTISGNISLIVLGFILIPRYHIWGAMYASIISHIIMYGMYFIYAKSEFVYE